IPPGLDHRTTREPQRPAALGGLPANADEHGYLLCLGTDFRHKNRLFALRLLAALRQRKGWDGLLLFAGTHVPHGSSQADEQSFIQNHTQLREHVLDLGSASEQEKDWLIENAAAVV